MLVAIFIALASFAAWLVWPRKTARGNLIRRLLPKRRKVLLSRIVRITAGGLHAWCESNVGLVRKPTNHPGVVRLLKTFEP